MRHALLYHGAFELNYDALLPGATEYTSTDGRKHPIAPVPRDIDGLVIGYMERSGKKFIAVRLRFEDRDVILRAPMVLDPVRHLGNRRFSGKPVIITDDLASTLLDDVIAHDPEQQTELALLLNRVNQVRRGDRDSIE